MKYPAKYTTKNIHWKKIKTFKKRIYKHSKSLKTYDDKNALVNHRNEDHNFNQEKV